MSDLKKTKQQLVEELAQVRRQLAQLEAASIEAEAPPRQAQWAEKLLRASVALNGSLNYEAVLDCILDNVGDFVGCEAACVLHLDGDNSARIFRWYGYPEFERTDSFSALTFDQTDIPTLRHPQKQKQAAVIPVVEPGQGWTHKLGASWIRSHVGVPICVDEEVVGLLHVDSGTAGHFSKADGERLQIFVSQASPALKNARMYNQARQEIASRVKAFKLERNFVSAVLDTAGALVMVLDLQGRILRFNRACEETTGYTFKEVQGQHFWSLFLTVDELAGIKAMFEALQEGRETDKYQSHWLTKDNRRRVISWTNTVLVDSTGSVEYVVCTGNDITEQQQLEERLVAIHQLGRELNLLRDEESIWEIALETAAFLLEFKSAGYGMVTDAAGELDYLYQPMRGIPTTVNLRLPVDTPSRINVLKTHSEKSGGVFTLISENLSSLEDHAWLTAPMMVKDRLIGVLDIESRSHYAFTANDQRLLQTLADQTAVAIENARLHYEARHRVDELTTMNMISQAITSTLNLQQTLTVITDHAVRLLAAGAASVVLNDQAEGNLWFNAASGGNSEFVRGKRLPVGQGIVGWVIEHGEPALVTDVSEDPRFFAKFDQETGFITESVICAPLRTGAQTIGAIEVINKMVGSFTPEDLQLLTWLATPAATAIENARLYELERTARRQAELLREATATLTSTLDLDRVLNGILLHLEEVVACDNASVFLQDEEWLQVVAERGVSRQETHALANRHYPTNNALYREISETRRPVILDNAQADARFEVWQKPVKIHGWMGVPLMVQSEVIGCLTLDSQRAGAYGSTEAELAQAFANQAAVAIQNARLFEEVRTGRKRLQSLSRRLVEVQETERRHIARELHDEAGQSLSSLMVNLRLLERKVNDPEAVLTGIVELKQMLNDVSENLHHLAINLRPASLDHLGLETTLRQHIEAFGRQNKLLTQFEAVGLEDKRLPPDVETNLYRVVQEALTNVVRHAQASQVDVLLERRGDQLVAIIEDNGVGFDAEKLGQSGRLGLLGMRERAEMLHGNLMIESAPGSGTTIYVEVPYDYSNSHR